jgi:signal transduction histidine kinase
VNLAWSVVVLSLVAVALDTYFTASYRPLLSEGTWAEHGWPLAPVANLGCALMGALIVSRYPRHALGWLLCASSLLCVTLAGEAYSVWVLDGDGPGSALGAHLVAWAAPLLGWPAFVALILIFLTAPDGRLASPRWRWAIWVTLGGLVLRLLGALLTPPANFVTGAEYSGSTAPTVILTVGYLLVAVGLIASAVCLVVRLRRSRDDERRQILWIAISAVMLAAGVIIILAVPRIQGVEGTWLAGLPLKLAQVAVPICVAVAVLRHRLLEIDLIVNRALVLAFVTVIVAGGYVLVVVALGRILSGGADGFWPSLLATAAVAVAFQPLRTRVIKLADRLAFGTAAAPYEALAEFSRQLGERPRPEQLLPAMAQAAGQAVNARHATAHLHVEQGPGRTARWPVEAVDDPSESRTQVPIVHHGQLLGQVTVAMAPGHPLRAGQHQLIADLAHQAALVFRNAHLAAELADQVSQLRSHTDDLAQSRRRLITAADAERQRLEQAIAGHVVPHLEALPGQLRLLSELAKTATEPVGSDIAALIESVNAALGSLREITRGVFPGQLSRSGLPTALRSLLARQHTPGQLAVTRTVADQRFDPRVEAAGYFCVAELAKDMDGPVLVSLAVEAGRLALQVSGTNQLPELRRGQMTDRIEATGGSVLLSSGEGRSSIKVSLPLTLS